MRTAVLTIPASAVLSQKWVCAPQIPAPAQDKLSHTMQNKQPCIPVNA